MNKNDTSEFTSQSCKADHRCTHEQFLTRMEQAANSNGRANHFDDMVTVSSLDLMNLIRIIRGEPQSIGISDIFASSDYAGLQRVVKGQEQ